MPKGTSFYLMILTEVVLLSILVYTLRGKRKSNLSRIFTLIIIELIIWQMAVLLEVLFGNTIERRLFLDNLTYIGSAFMPVSMLLLSLAYGGSTDQFPKWSFWLLVVPTLTQIILWTNPWHHLFYQSFDPLNGAVSPGTYFYFHALFSYICLLLSFGYQTYYAAKRAGALSMQSILIIVGNLVPTIVNVGYTLSLPGFNVYSTPLAFTVTCVCYLLGMFRYSMLTIVPVALQTVINRISDSFVVLDKDLNVLDYNATFEQTFLPLFFLRKGKNARQILASEVSEYIHIERIHEIIMQIIESHDIIKKETEIMIGNTKYYFTVEFTPIVQKSFCTAVIVLLKDVTQHVKDLEMLQANQDILLERERLASLGQMIGGIAHNMKTPIMSVSGGIDQLMFLTNEYRVSIDDPEVNSTDHYEIADEMQQWLAKMKQHLSYMSDIISTVKEQASKFNTASDAWFSLDELLKRVNILMHHELIKNQCQLKCSIYVNTEILLNGDINSLIQVLDNIIVNAIQAYEGKPGIIDLEVSKDDAYLIFVVSDYAKGIDEKVKDRLCKEMITTNGKHGTGLGLYMSYSTIKGVFRGNMWFRSEPNKGTKFTIQIPLHVEKEAPGIYA